MECMYYMCIRVWWDFWVYSCLGVGGRVVVREMSLISDDWEGVQVLLDGLSVEMGLSDREVREE